MADAPELKTAVEEVQRAFDEFKKTNDEALEAKANKGDVDPLVTIKLDKLQTTIEEKTALLDAASANAAAEFKSQEDRMNALETALNRSNVSPGDEKSMLELREHACAHIITEAYESARPIDIASSDLSDDDVKAYQVYADKYHFYIRKGHARFFKEIEGHETKLLSVDRDPGGGFWVNPEMSDKIIMQVFETSPIRQFANIENIGSDSLEMITDLNEAGSGFVAEQESRTETTTPDIGKRVIHAHELFAEPRSTQKLLDDAQFNVEAWLSRKVAERFARDEATAFVTGNGVGRPRGMTTYPAGTSITSQIEQIASGTSGAVTSDGLFDLLYSLKSPYLRNARFMAPRLIIRDLRKLKDAENRYLWEPTFQAGQPAMIIGFAIHQADDFADAAAGSLSIAFGDFKEAYTIVDRKGIRVLRDPFTAKPFIKFYTTKRVGGDIVNFEAIKLQVLDA